MTIDKKKHSSKPTEANPSVPETPAELSPEMVSIPLAEFAGQMKELEELRQQSFTAMDGWQRERADFSNYRKRMEHDQEMILQNTTIAVIKKYLVILDDLERANKTRPNEGEAGNWAEGIEFILRKLQGILEAEGVQPIPADGAFDPNLHEAISHETSSDFGSGQVIEIVQQGYKIGDRVIRPALVKVAQ